MGQAYAEPAIVKNFRDISSVQGADGFASVTGACGDTMDIWLGVRYGAIREAFFSTDGCGTTIAAGSVVTELARGRAVSDALRITQQDVVDALGGLPRERVHCALLAASALKEAVKDYLACSKEPWKRLYRQQ